MELLSQKEAAAYLGISSRWVRVLIKQRKFPIPSCFVANRAKWTREHLEAWTKSGTLRNKNKNTTSSE